MPLNANACSTPANLPCPACSGRGITPLSFPSTHCTTCGGTGLATYQTVCEWFGSEPAIDLFLEAFDLPLAPCCPECESTGICCVACLDCADGNPSVMCDGVCVVCDGAELVRPDLRSDAEREADRQRYAFDFDSLDLDDLPF